MTNVNYANINIHGGDPALPPKYTPWGPWDHCEKIAEGIHKVSTPGHGGYKLDRKRNALVSPILRLPGGWYEEDCEWARVALTFSVHFDVQTIEHAKRSLKSWNWKLYEAFYKEIIPEGASHSKDQDNFFIKHAEHWCGRVAWSGDREGISITKGQILVYALLGKHCAQNCPDEKAPESYWLVKKERYDTRNGGTYVIDTLNDTRLENNCPLVQGRNTKEVG